MSFIQWDIRLDDRAWTGDEAHNVVERNYFLLAAKVEGAFDEAMDDDADAR